MYLIPRQTSPDSATQLRVIAELRSGLGGLLATLMLLLRSGALLRPWRIPAMLAFARLFDGMVEELCAVLTRAVTNVPASNVPASNVKPRVATERRRPHGRPRLVRAEAMAPALPAVRRHRVRVWLPTLRAVWAFAAPLAVRTGWKWRRGPPQPGLEASRRVSSRARNLFRLRIYSA